MSARPDRYTIGACVALSALLSVAVWGLAFGLMVRCTNDNDCGADCPECNHLDALFWLLLLAVWLVPAAVIVRSRDRSPRLTRCYLALVAVIIVTFVLV